MIHIQLKMEINKEVFTLPIYWKQNNHICFQNQVVFIIKFSNGTKNYIFEQGLHLALLLQRFGTLQNSQLSKWEIIPIVSRVFMF